jgi:hypothetical protein
MKYPNTLTDFIKPFDIQKWCRAFAGKYRATPLGAGLGSSRFSSPSHRFTVLYSANSVRAATCESVIRDRFEKTEARRIITSEEIDKFVVAPISTKSSLNLIDFSENQTLYTLGLPHDIIGASDHRFGQSFSELAYNDTKVDGILYPSRFLSDLCCVVYDRAIDKLVRVTAKQVTDLGREPSLNSDLQALGIQIIK